MIVSQLFDRKRFETFFNVSHETIEDLDRYCDLLDKWNRRINLVSQSTLPMIWHRHFADSMQLWQLKGKIPSSWLDVGSGAGFPGLVIAILAKNSLPDLKVTLVESDQRKCAFLLRVAQDLGLDIDIKPVRIENMPNAGFDIISARALASLNSLLELCQPFCHESTLCLFPKGNKHESELTQARKIWHIESEQISSITDANAVIFRIESFSRAR